MKLPMNRKTIGFAMGANTSRTGATWNITASVGPSSAVTANGNASVTQKVMTRAVIAARRCASGESPSIGTSSTTSSTTGPTASPVFRRSCFETRLGFGYGRGEGALG